MPSGNSWRPGIRHVQDGQAANAGNLSRPARDLADNQRYLREWLQEAELGEAIVAHNVTIHPDLLPGQGVFYNTTTQQYEPALAAVVSDPDSGALVAADSAECIGVLGVKHNETLGTLILGGRAKLDITLAVPEDATPGRYYLSAATPGMLVRQRPPVSVSVLYYDGEYVHVQPVTRDFLEDHIHYKFDLVALPAGTANEPSEGEVHEVTVADADAEGWLPADHESFAGASPVGAKFGYNFAAHIEVERIWPPIPLAAAAVEVERPPLTGAATDVLIGGTTMASRFVEVTQSGIWWMSDCYNQAPWPADFAVGSSISSASSASSAAAAEACGPDQLMRITIYFAKAVFATDRSVVTSLQPAAGSPITVLDCDGEAGTTGELFLALNLAFLVDDTIEITGGEVLKTLDDVTFRKGWVTEGLLAGNNVTITGSRTRVLTSAEQTSLSHAGPLHQGAVRLDVDLSPGERELAPQIIRLGDAKERTFQETPHIGFPPDRVSAVRLRFNVPPVGLPADPHMLMRIQLLGRATGTMPEITVTRRHVLRVATATALPNDSGELAVPFDAEVAITAGEYLEIESDGFEVVAGDTVYVTISRAADDAYAGEVGALRFGGVIYAGGS
jgi:hypothetical protein